MAAFVGQVQAGGGNDGSSTTVVTGSRATTTGNHIVVGVLFTINATPPSITITDTAGNVYTQIGVTQRDTDNQLAMFWSSNITGNAANVVTATFGTAVTYRRCHQIEISAPSTISVENFYYQTVSTGTTPATASIVISSAGIAISCLGTYNVAGNPTAGSGFTRSSSDDYLHDQYQVSASGGTYPNSMTLSGSDIRLVMIGVGFRDSSGSTSYTITPSGGITLSGAPTILKGQVFTPSGGLSFSGTTSIIHGVQYTPSGGISFSGTNTFVRATVFQPSGGILFSGDNEFIHTVVYDPSGGVAFTGTAPMTFSGSTSYIITPSGGIIFGGTTTLILERHFLPSGGILFNGTAIFEFSHIQIPVGSLILLGSAPIIFTPAGGGGVLASKLPLTFVGH